MKLYLTLALLLLAGPAGAGEPNKSFRMGNGEGTVVRIFNYDECRTTAVKCRIYMDPVFGLMVTRDNKTQPDCLAQMEAAMRAMEPYSAILSTEDNYERTRAALIDREAARRALKQWDAAKACWRTP